MITYLGENYESDWFQTKSAVAGGLCSTHCTSSSEHFALNILKNIGVLKHLKMISLNPADPNKRQYPRKFDTKILTPKS